MAEIRMMLRCCVCLVLCIFTHPAFSSQTPCQIDFPTINSSVITVESGTTVTLPFTLNIDSCMDTSGDLEVMVTSNESGLLCHIEMLDDSCYLVDGACNCLPARHEFQVNVTVDQSDSSSRLMFRARVSTGQEFNAELFVNLITYPARVTSLTFDAGVRQFLHGVVDANTPVEIICLWDHGNPPVTARLLDRHGVEMEGSNYSKGEIQYRFPAVSCQDAGLIRCEAPGASHNQTVKLLVRCPPEFLTQYKPLIVNGSGQSLQQDFAVRTHTTALSSCLMLPPVRLSELTSDVKTSSFCNLTGTPPDLTLNVRLDNVSKEEEGQWRLELANDAGSGHLDILILIAREPEFQLDGNKSEISVVPGQTIEVEFPVKSHTTHFKNCQLSRGSSKRDDSDNDLKTHESLWLSRATISGRDCMSLMNLTGTPPDLTLTVSLGNVREEKEGQWRLELTSDAGTGHVDFNIHVTEKESHTADRSSHEDINVTAVIPAVLLVVVLLGIIISVIVVRVRRGITASSNPAGKLEMDAVVFRKRNSGKDLSRQSSFCAPNIYWEIPDKPESIALPFDAPPPPPCRKALRPRSDVLYLTPSMSPDIPAALDSTKRNRMRPVSEIASPTYRRRANNLPEPEDGLTPFAAQATPSAVQTTPKDLSIKDDLLFKTSPRVPFGPCQDLQAPLKTDSNLSDKFSRPKSLPVSGLSLFGDDLSLSVKISRLPFGSCPDLQASVTPGSNSSDDYSTASSVEKQRRQTDSDYVPMTRGPGRYFGENQGKKLHHQMSCGANKSRGKQGRKSDGGFFQTSRGSDGYFGDQGKKLDPGYVQMSRGANSCHLSGNLGRKADCDYVSMCRGSSSPSGENQGREVEPFYVPMSPGANSSQFTEKLGKEADSGHDPVSLGVDNIERGREADDDYVPMSREVFFAHENVPSASFPTESGSNESGEDFRYHQDDVNVFHN